MAQLTDRSIPQFVARVTWITIVTILLLGFVWLALDETVTEWIRQWHQTGRRSALVYSAGVIVILALDLFLPIPSSVVMTHCGMTLGWLGGVGIAMIGLTIGSLFGFWLGRVSGRRLLANSLSEDDYGALRQMVKRYGVTMLLVLRPVPIFAEASLIFLGLNRMKWNRFVPWLLVSNLTVVSSFTWLGIWSRQREIPEFWAVLISIVIPLGLLGVLRFYSSRWLKPDRSGQEKSDVDIECDS